MPASKYCFWLQSRAFFAPRAPSAKNKSVHRCNNFVNFVYDLLFSLCLPCFEHVFANYHLIFWKYVPRPRWEAWFWKRHKSKIMKHMPLRPSNYACMHPFCTIYCNLKFAKFNWKNVYYSFIAPFRKLHLASSALSHVSEVTFPRSCIASGLLLCKNACRTRDFKSESSCNTCFGSPTYKQINTISVLFPAMQAITNSSSCNRRLLIACFPSPIGNCMQSINWRAAVCPPQRAFNLAPSCGRRQME